MCLSADWAGMLILSNSSVHCFVWCVWVCISRPCMLLLALDVPVSVGLCLCASRVVFFSWCCGALLFRCCCSVFLVWLPSRFLFALVAWVLEVWPALSWFPPPSPPPLVVFWCFLVQSVFCWSLPPDIWLYLQRSGCHTFGMACRG